MIIWLAYGETGAVSLEAGPPLIKAAALPLKRAPDDPGGEAVAELGGVGALLTDQPETAGEERLMPTPEQPLSPAEEAVASLGQKDTPGAEIPSPEQRAKAKVALEKLVSELNANSPATPSGAGGPVSATTETLPTPSRPDVARTARVYDDAEQTNQPESSGEISVAPISDPASDGIEVSGDVQVAAVGDVAVGNGDVRFQGTPGGRFRVQLAAVREESDAQRAWTLFKDQLGAFVGGLEPFFERAETNNGTFYRVQIGPFADNGEANSLCIELKKRNASCFVVSR
ncbi:MAG: SPOR domain-containing protein [Aestuariivirgaceae bacterium]